jgi:sulfur transfer protein SufE
MDTPTRIDTQHIVRAIAAHAKWKYRLRQAITTGASDWTVPDVRVDDKCDFGCWLCSFPPEARADQHWKAVSARHAEFHRAAAHVLALALSGKIAEAEAAIAPKSTFAEVSKQLTLAMMAWRKHIEG